MLSLWEIGSSLVVSLLVIVCWRFRWRFRHLCGFHDCVLVCHGRLVISVVLNWSFHSSNSWIHGRFLGVCCGFRWFVWWTNLFWDHHLLRRWRLEVVHWGWHFCEGVHLQLEQWVLHCRNCFLWVCRDSHWSDQCLHWWCHIHLRVLIECCWGYWTLVQVPWVIHFDGQVFREIYL